MTPSPDTALIEEARAEATAISQDKRRTIYTDLLGHLLSRLADALTRRVEGEGWRPEVRAFADLMEAQLRANDHKPGWKKDSDLDLFERLGEEKAELLTALHRHAKRLSWGDGWVMETDTEQRIGREAADVANFAMMIADVCGALALTPPASGEG